MCVRQLAPALGAQRIGRWSEILPRPRAARARAAPAAAQCAASGRRKERPVRKVTIAAGRPLSSPAARPSRLTGSGQACRAPPDVPSAPGRRAGLAVHALFIECQDEGAAIGLQVEIGILHAFGDALEGQRRADVVAGEQLFQLLELDIGIDGHRAQAPALKPRNPWLFWCSVLCIGSRLAIVRRPNRRLARSRAGGGQMSSAPHLERPRIVSR